MHKLYGWRQDCLEHIVALVSLLGSSWKDRPEELKKVDREKEANPSWFQSNKMLGGVCYVDRYAKNLDGVVAKIPYFQVRPVQFLSIVH